MITKKYVGGPGFVIPVNPVMDFQMDKILPSPLRRHMLSKCEVY